MRRFLLPVFALCLVFAVAGCDDDSPAPDAGASDSQAKPATAHETPTTAQDGPAATEDGNPATGDAAAATAEGGSCCEKSACDKTTCDKSKCGEGCKCKTGATADACVCAAGKAGASVWCKACNKGYVDGEPAHCPNCVKKAIKAAAAKAEQ